MAARLRRPPTTVHHWSSAEDGKFPSHLYRAFCELADESGLMRWTGASERTVKYWFAGERGPSGEHLVSLARHSDVVLVLLLTMADRLVLEDGEG